MAKSHLNLPVKCCCNSTNPSTKPWPPESSPGSLLKRAN